MTYMEIGLVLGTMYFINRLVLELFISLKEYFQNKRFHIKQNKIWLYFSVIIFVYVLDKYVFTNNDILQLGATLGLLMALGFGLLALLVKLLVWISELKRSGKKTFTSITNKGFKLLHGSKTKQYYWDDFHSAIINKDLSLLELKGKASITVNSNVGNFYALLKKIPKGLKDLEYQLIENYFSELKTCLVCSCIAVKDEKCIVCSSESWNAKMAKEYTSYSDYIKANQLEIFATMEKSEVFCDFKLDNINFETDKDWKPIVTKKEVLEYSKKEFWDSE